MGKELDYSAICDSPKCLLYAVDATKIIQRFENDKGSKRHFQALANRAQKIHNTRITSTQSLYDSYSSVLAERRLMSNPFSKGAEQLGGAATPAGDSVGGHLGGESRERVIIPGM